MIALLLLECRILFKNRGMTEWVEEDFSLFLTETHRELRKSTGQQSVKDAVDDVFEMVKLDEKK